MTPTRSSSDHDMVEAFSHVFHVNRTAAAPATVPFRRQATRRFDGAVHDRLTASWLSTGVHIDQELRGQLDALRTRSRDLAKNNEYVIKFLRMVRTNVIGPQGFILQARVKDPNGNPDSGANSAIEAAWSRWMRSANCDVTGRRHFNTMLRELVRGVARDGEYLIRRVSGPDRGEFGYQLQLLDVARIDTTRNQAPGGGRNAIVNGVEVDAYQKPVAMWIRVSQINSAIGSYNVERIPMSELWHGFIPFETEQTRGIPWTHGAMRRLNDLGGYREAAVIAARIGASKMGFYTTPDGLPPNYDEKSDEGEFIQQAEPGEFGVLPAGYDFKPFDPRYPHEQFDAFCKATLRGVAGALGVAYNGLASDLENVNYSSIRAGVLEERDGWMEIQDWLINELLVPLFEEWLDYALMNGKIVLGNGSALPAAKRDKFAAHDWQPRRWRWVDPKNDIEAAVIAINNRIASPQQIIAQSGLDAEDVLDAVAAFEAMARVKGVDLRPPPPVDKSAATVGNS